MSEKSHKIGVVGLTAIGIGTMIGSGWLFSSFYAARIAGSGAYFSWGITALIILILGLALAEIASLYPKQGLMARLLVITHNKEFAFICTISTWLGLTAVIATETLGSVQYLSNLSPTFGEMIINNDTHMLNPLGLGIAIFMILIFCLLNFWGAKLMSTSNVAITALKIFIPCLTAITILYAYFDSANFTANGSGFLPNGDASTIFVAMIASGMIYSFNGFQNIVSFSSETKNPKKDIPLAMFLAILLTVFIYILLQTAFIGALSPDDLKNGWSGLNFTSPFVQLTVILNLNLITLVLYFDAVVSPSGTGLIYTGATTRLLTAMSQDKQMPKYFDYMCKYNFSRRALIATVLFAITFLLLFKSWSALVAFLSLFYVISYMSIPIALGKIRSIGLKGNTVLPLVPFLMPCAFAFLSCLFVFSKYPYTAYVSLFVIIAYLFFIITQYKSHPQGFIAIFKNSCLMLFYLVSLSIISYLGPKVYGGIDLISNFYIFFVLLVIVSLVTYFISVFKYGKSFKDIEKPQEI